MVEIWDAYDKNFCKIENVRLVRGEVIPEGIYHLVCEIIVKHIDGTYLLMQRDFKKHLGGMWELTADGSALTNETPIECAIREYVPGMSTITYPRSLPRKKPVAHETVLPGQFPVC